jgi:hypothetical protein
MNLKVCRSLALRSLIFQSESIQNSFGMAIYVLQLFPRNGAQFEGV